MTARPQKSSLFRLTMVQLFPYVGKHTVTVGTQFLIQSPERNSDNIAMMQFGAKIIAEFQPNIVDQVDIFRPEARRMGTEVHKNGWPAGRDDFQRERMAG